MRANVRGVIAGLAALIVVPAAMLSANAASADSIQVQSYQRANQEEACTTQPGETPWQASWGSDASWKATWEQWANGGKGGWTCTRSITWAKSSNAGGAGVTYALGDIGPGGGLVFLISDGLTYEMAPKSWRGAGIQDAPATWCDGFTNVPSATGTAIGTGDANTAAMAAPSSACSSNAAAAVLAYPGTDGSTGEWFLPSKVELNAMCNYSRNPSSPALPSVGCSGSQDATFAAGTYGFANDDYWSSSQFNASEAWLQNLPTGGANHDGKAGNLMRVRAIRAF